MNRFAGFFVACCFVAIALVAGIVWLGNKHWEETRPVTTVTALLGGDYQQQFILTSTNAFGATSQGLPDSEKILELNSTALSNANIFVVETEGEVAVYLDAGDLYGDAQYWAFPLGAANYIDWRGASIFYIRDEALVAGAAVDPSVEIGSQIATIRQQVGGTVSPVLNGENILLSPVFCLDPLDMTSCRYWWFETSGNAIIETIELGDFTFLVLESVSGPRKGVATRIYIPVTGSEAKRITDCLAEITSASDQVPTCA